MGLAKGLAFLLVLALFGFGFWMLSGDNLETLTALVQSTPAPAPEPTPPPQPLAPAAPPVIILDGPGGTVRLPDGATDMIELGHDNHRVRVTASVSGDTVSLWTKPDGALTATNGEVVVFHCPEKGLHRETRGGRLTMSPVPCPHTATVTVRLERPDGAES